MPREVDNTLSNGTISVHNQTLSPPTNCPKGSDNDSVSSSDAGKLDQFAEGDSLLEIESDTASHQGLIQT